MSGVRYRRMHLEISSAAGSAPISVSATETGWFHMLEVIDAKHVIRPGEILKITHRAMRELRRGGWVFASGKDRSYFIRRRRSRR